MVVEWIPAAGVQRVQKKEVWGSCRTKGVFLNCTRVGRGMQKAKIWEGAGSWEDPSSRLGFLVAPAVHLVYSHFLPILISLIWEQTVAMLQRHQDGKTWQRVVNFCRSNMNFIHVYHVLIESVAASLHESQWSHFPNIQAQMVKNLPAVWETWLQSLGWEDPLEKGMATHSSILAWRFP